MRITIASDIPKEQVEKARAAATMLITKDAADFDIERVCSSNNLEDVEEAVKKLAGLTSKCWLMLALVLYTLIYDTKLFEQSGLSWQDYSSTARLRLGLDQRDITELLSAARFFIRHHEKLIESGWSPLTSMKKLARAELALRLSDDLDETIEHLVKDSFRGFKRWYSSKKSPSTTPEVNLHIKNGKFYVGDTEAITLSKELTKRERGYLRKCISHMVKQIQSGIDPTEGDEEEPDQTDGLKG